MFDKLLGMDLVININHILIILNLEVCRENSRIFWVGYILIILGNADPEGQGYCQAGFSLDFYKVNSFVL